MDLAQPLAYADDTFLQGAPAPTTCTRQSAPSIPRTAPPRSPATWACATLPTVSLLLAPPAFQPDSPRRQLRSSRLLPHGGAPGTAPGRPGPVADPPGEPPEAGGALAQWMQVGARRPRHAEVLKTKRQAAPLPSWPTPAQTGPSPTKSPSARWPWLGTHRPSQGRRCHHPACHARRAHAVPAL
jgi:hypothetical protein